MNTRWITYKKLELIPDHVPEPPSFRRSHFLLWGESVVAWLRESWESVLDDVLYPPQPRVVVRCDRHGKLHWFVSDPATGTSAYLDSEEAVRCWLERRYSHRPEDGNGPQNFLRY